MRNCRACFRSGALAAAVLAAGLAAAEGPFSAPEQLTGDGERYRLARSAPGSAAFGPGGTLHLTYWSGGEVTNPSSPSHVYYRSWTHAAGWTEEVLVDSSETPGGERVGGRNPALAVSPDGDTLIVWQDHRHCTADHAWIDNIELYGRTLPAGAAEFGTETRLTETNAPHNGDNGYAPKLALMPDGSVALVWYDFHDDRDVSDIHLQISDADWQFDTTSPITDHRRTDRADRGGSLAYTLPTAAADPAGTLHLCWIGGTEGNGPVYYGTFDPETSGFVYTEVMTGGGDFFSPPHVAVGPDGVAWIVIARPVGGGTEVALLGMPEAGTEPPDVRTPFPSASSQPAPSAAFDADGNMHVAWLEGGAVWYGLYDPAEDAALERVQVSAEAGTYRRPLALPDPEGRPHVLYEQEIGFAAGALWFAAPADTTALPAGEWLQYE